VARKIIILFTTIKKSEINDKINIKKLAMENYFYGKGISGQIIEENFGKFENKVKECYRQVYSKIDNFSLAKKMIKENPKLKNLENKVDVEFQKNFKPGSSLIHFRNIGY